jgi:regulatory protein
MPSGSGSALSAENVAMNLLARREHSRAELAEKLRKREFEPEEVDATISSLAERNLVSDERFAESFTSGRIRRGQGPVRIRQELRQRGVADALIEACLVTLAPDWGGIAIEVRRKKFGAAVPDDFKEKARQMRFLQYRGFTTDQIQAAFGGAADYDDA